MLIKTKRNQIGQVMVGIIILILVIMVIALASLMSSRTSIKLSADFRGKTSLYYRAEEGVNSALATFISQEPYSVYTKLSNLAPYAGLVTCDANHAAVPSSRASSISCDLFSGTGNNKKGILVMVTRKPDYCKGGFRLPAGNATCESNGDVTNGQVYLVNSVATDETGRKEIVQGVIIWPRLSTLIVGTASTYPSLTPGTKLHPFRNAYLSSLVRGAEHVEAAATTTTSTGP